MGCNRKRSTCTTTIRNILQKRVVRGCAVFLWDGIYITSQTSFFYFVLKIKKEVYFTRVAVTTQPPEYRDHTWSNLPDYITKHAVHVRKWLTQVDTKQCVRGCAVFLRGGGLFNFTFWLMSYCLCTSKQKALPRQEVAAVRWYNPLFTTNYVVWGRAVFFVWCGWNSLQSLLLSVM